MLFMSIYTYEPGNKEAVINRRLEKGPLVQEGTKIVGEWSSIAGGRNFRLVEVDNPRSMLGSAAAWNDLGNIEIFPVMQTEEVFKLLAANK
jgi:hypothetical protein